MRTPPEERKALARAAAKRSSALINKAIEDIAQGIIEECEGEESILAAADEMLCYDFYRCYLLARIAFSQWVRDHSMNFPHTPSEIAAHTDPDEVVDWLAHHPALPAFIEEVDDDIEHFSSIAANRLSTFMGSQFKPMTNDEIRQRRLTLISLGRLPPDAEIPPASEEQTLWDLLDTNS